MTDGEPRELVDDYGDRDSRDEEEAASAPPKALKRVFSEFLGMSVGGGPRYHPVFEKFTPSHVDKFLDHIHANDCQERDFRRSNRWFQFGYVFLAVAVVVGLVAFLLPRDKELLVELLKAGLLFTAGVGSGYGLKSHLEERSRRH